MGRYLLIIILLGIGILMPFHGHAQDDRSMADRYPVIPVPKKIEYGMEELVFTSILVSGNAFSQAAPWLEFLSSQGIGKDRRGTKFHFIKDSTLAFGEEGYSLHIDSVVTVSGASDKGIFYGIQTLKQLFRSNTNGAILPQVTIVDRPSFAVRGFMHDTGRNYQSVAQLKEQIEVLANYKYNVFHWHLTDNPAWRLESKKYPQLQSDVAFSRDIGQFYTQEDFKEILAFCAARHITLIPEFDVPGHTAAFRRAFGLESMQDSRVMPILFDLFDELMGLADPNTMPYIHMGTDEVREKSEFLNPEYIRDLMEHIAKKGHEVLVWKEGIEVQGDSISIQQLWAQHPPSQGHRFIDSRANYINHLDPLAGMVRLFFQQPCRQPKGDALALGGILCAWPDNDVLHERDILQQNPIYPAMVFYADAIWNGRAENDLEHWSKLPQEGTLGMQRFKDFEKKVLVHRDRFFKDKEFPYLQNSNIPWLIIGPFDHGGDFSKSFPVEQEITGNYTVNGEVYEWKGPYFGGTIHLKHFFGFPSITHAKAGTFYARTQIYAPEDREQDFWIGFQGWSRSGGRRGGPFPEKGQWHITEPKIWVNHNEVKAPDWQQPGLGIATDEIPFIDEDYFYRKPTVVSLKKGWNNILIKIPHGDPSWKWMFTCIPISLEDGEVREVTDLRFATQPNAKDK